MDTPKHTPEPWPTDMRGIVFANGALACGYVAPNSEPYHNSNRAVACVNACAGINPEAVPDLLAALKSMLNRDERNICRHEETHRGGSLWEICDACAMRWADDEGGKPGFQEPQEWLAARAAIAKAEGRAE